MNCFLLTTIYLISTVAVIGQNSEQLPAWKGRWTERQTERGAIEWIFHGKDSFSKLNYWAGLELDGRIHKGTYQIDTVRKVVVLRFRKVFDIKNDSVLPIDSTEEWKIESMATNQLLLSRQFIDDKINKGSEKENVFVRLVRTIKEGYEPIAGTQ